MDIRGFFGNRSAKAAKASPDSSPGQVAAAGSPSGAVKSKFFAAGAGGGATDEDAPARVAKRKAEELAAEAEAKAKAKAKAGRTAKLAAAMDAGAAKTSPSENKGSSENKAGKKGSPSPAKKAKTAGGAAAGAGAGAAAAGEDPYGFVPTESKKKGGWYPGKGAGVAPPNAGSKPVPAGKPNCLAGKAFCLTGVLDSLQREEAEALVTKYGGVLKSGVSSKVDFLLAGALLEDGRALAEGSKHRKMLEFRAKGKRIAQIDEDGLFEMIAGSVPQQIDLTEAPAPAQPRIGHVAGFNAGPASSSPHPSGAVAAASASSSSSSSSSAAATSSNSAAAPASGSSSAAAASAAPKAPAARFNPYAKGAVKSSFTPMPPKPAGNPYAKKAAGGGSNPYAGASSSSSSSSSSAGGGAPAPPAKTIDDNAARLAHDGDIRLWADKYRPSNSRELVGNPNIVRNLQTWLRSWEAVHLKGGAKPRGSKENPGAKAVLLSGPPGIGKTSAATIIGRELGYEVQELNASDARNKAALSEGLSDVIGTQVLSFGGGGGGFSGGPPKPKKKRLIIMDEVDGMSSGDRGGMVEMIALIKKSKTPIICICNDRDSQKVKSLAGHCYDLKFQRPAAAQIAQRMVQVGRMEKMAVEHAAVVMIAEQCGNDIRQVLNMMQMWSKRSASMSLNKVEGEMRSLEKDEALRVSPAEAANRICDLKLPLAKRQDGYFVDYNFVPLLVQVRHHAASPPLCVDGSNPCLVAPPCPALPCPALPCPARPA